ncbi:MAG: DNA helicase RecQ [Ruminococcus sp.]|nr:DNA helicase RecQ [Ruminococcus sp.]
MDELNQKKYELLKSAFGHDSFRDGQEPLIDAILSGRDTLGIMPTGAGKSVCYQLPALMLDGVTLVISPLISLMKDQVNSLIQSGISAAYLNSSLTAAQYETAISRAKTGSYKIIYVAPERLDTPSFKSLSDCVKISMICVDEAHCVSQWGQDFRPSYLKIHDFAASLSVRPIICAFTATATDIVKADIIKMLELKDPFCVTTGFDRKNLYFGVRQPHDKLAEVVRLVREYKDMSGIIYCSTRKNTELVCDRLNEVGIPCTRYHAGLSDSERRKNQDDFLYDRVRVMSATNAFGMGIDKSNVGFVIHYNMPKNLESYYQEAGRAGRDGSEAICTLLFSRADVSMSRFLIQSSNENSELDYETSQQLLHRDYERLNSMVEYCTTTDCLRGYILRYFGESAPPSCGKCSSCDTSFETADVTVDSQKILSCVYRLAQRKINVGAVMLADILRGSKSKRIRDMRVSDLSTYGIMSEASPVRLRDTIEGLVHMGYLRRGDHDELILQQKATAVLKGRERVEMRFKSKQASTTARSRAKSTQGGELFELLRQKRAQIAQRARVPAYIILSDASLHDMCAKLPLTREAILTVAGVGKTKAERYGDEFISVIADYRAKNPSAKYSDDSEMTLLRRKKSQQISHEPGSKQTSAKKALKARALTELSSEIALERKADEERVLKLLTDFLEREGMISTQGEILVTPKGGLSGITLSTKLTPQGAQTVIKLSGAAQRMIFRRLDEILG